ncbi:lateral flagellin LafA [Metapseudomonas otitidis]|uniref:Flagellin n=1 Tax=Metapseudomonas otitidis TaxID=319939 RepID=A0A679GTG8_9GAMM|nr:lateral flagellin LafA [Pseudomonas otitidis]WIF65315.1 lateral flagellin LafA [Pseudomonas otitidis]BCA29334.1 lateral flagellin [Pseudomonas otitidis]
MALSIHTNYSALVTQSSLNRTNSTLALNQQRLGTGLRINSASDDAAGLQIATRLNAQTRGMGVANRNTGDATSLLQTAEGAFNEITSIVQRMKDLATQSANDTNSAKDRTSIQAEFDQLAKEVENIFGNTTYAGDNLFSDSGKFSKAVNFQIGATAAETLTLDVSADMATLKKTLTDDLQALKLDDNANAKAGITALDSTLDAIGGMRASFGANINRLNHTANNLANMKDNTDLARGRILDADIATESANMTKNTMLMQSGISMLKQAGQMPSLVMSLLG